MKRLNKGIIMELKKNYAIALNDEGVMDKIVFKNDMQVGKKIFYFEDDIISATTTKVNRYNNFIRAVGSIAALFLIVFTFFHTMRTETAFAVVSLDINPSIQIEADSKQNIIKVEGVNTDGKNIDFTDIKDMSLDDGIQKIKEKLVEKKYLDTNNEVLVGYAFIDSKKNQDNSIYEKDLRDAIQSTFNTEKVTYVKCDKDAVDEAKTKGISLGRYEASILTDDNTKNTIDKAPVKDITSSIKDKDNVTQWAAEDEKNNTPLTNINSDIKPEKPGNESTIINAPSDKGVKDSNPGKTIDDINKPDKDKDVLQLQPELPAQNGQNGNPNNSKDDSIIIDPNKDSMENNQTSGKIEENPKNTQEDSSKSNNNLTNKN